MHKLEEFQNFLPNRNSNGLSLRMAPTLEHIQKLTINLEVQTLEHFLYQKTGLKGGMCVQNSVIKLKFRFWQKRIWYQNQSET